MLVTDPNFKNSQDIVEHICKLTSLLSQRESAVVASTMAIMTAIKDK